MYTTREPTRLKKGTVVGMVTAANIVPPMLAAKTSTNYSVLENGTGESENACIPKNAGTYSCQAEQASSKHPQLTPERCSKLFENLKLESLESWSADDQEKAVDLLKEFHHLFALSDMELGCTSEVKHTIKVNDPVPFKQRYRQIPPHQYQEVKNHLKEMLKVGAIRKSVSPWASLVVLVRKKDGSLCFCIDLRKLNLRTIRDAYSLPQIEESLDSLNGACIFTSLDLKSGYWQVLMDEKSIPLTAFTVGPLGFYECVRMPFGLTNAPTTFQRLMESCFG